jgi:hypothetical protein
MRTVRAAAMLAKLPNDEVGAVWRYRAACDLTQLTPSST